MRRTRRKSDSAGQIGVEMQRVVVARGLGVARQILGGKGADLALRQFFASARQGSFWDHAGA